MYDSSTTSILVKGNSHNRGVRAHKIVMEAMFHLQWHAFVQWLSQQVESLVYETLVVEQVIDCVQTLVEGKDVLTAMHTICVMLSGHSVSNHPKKREIETPPPPNLLKFGVWDCQGWRRRYFNF